MKIKDITISIFAIIGFVTILSSFNNQNQETHSTPESHIWEMHSIGDANTYIAYSFNKVTGEVRKYANSSSVSTKMDGAFIVSYEISPKK